LVLTCESRITAVCWSKQSFWPSVSESRRKWWMETQCITAFIVLRKWFKMSS